MAQNITPVVITNEENEIAERLVNRLVGHADHFGVAINEDMAEDLHIFFAQRMDETEEELMEGLQNFFAEVIEEERGEAAYAEPVADRLAAALQGFAVDLEGGYY